MRRAQRADNEHKSAIDWRTALDVRASWEEVHRNGEDSGAFRTIYEPVQSEPVVPSFSSRSQVKPRVEAVGDFRSEKGGCLDPLERIKFVPAMAVMLRARLRPMLVRVGHVSGVTWRRTPGLARGSVDCVVSVEVGSEEPMMKSDSVERRSW